jgi:hypothetical protein
MFAEALLDSLTLKMKALRSVETSVSIYLMKRLNMPEESDIPNLCFTAQR